jgi:signal transduction histidine kinase
MEARATRLGGSVLVKPGPERGTEVEWRVPLAAGQ